MKLIQKVALLALSAASLLLAGCFDKSRDDSKQPWARRASWEMQGPNVMGF